MTEVRQFFQHFDRNKNEDFDTRNSAAVLAVNDLYFLAKKTLFYMAHVTSQRVSFAPITKICSLSSKYAFPVLNEELMR